jgi:hemoglobin
LFDGMETLFQKFDSQYQVQQLAEEFYDVMDRDAKAKELRKLHPENLFFTKKILYRFLVHWSGGPELFSAEYTNSTWLELRHRNVELSEKNQQQWLYCMETAMCNLEFKEKFIKELLARFSSLINSMLARRSGLDAEC